MNAGIPQPTTRGPFSPPVSPVQQIGTGQNHQAQNHNKQSFNTITNNYYYGAANGYRQRVSATPSLSSIVENSSSNPLARQTSKDPDLVDGLPSHSPTSEVEASVYEHSEAGFSRASTSRVSRLGSVKSRLTIMMKTMSLGSRKSLQSELKQWIASDIDRVDHYLPIGMHEKFKNYMRSPHLPQKNAIPVWNPNLIQEINVTRRIRIDVGDVGTFTSRGGFRVAFNILLNKKTNLSCGYDVPKNFSRLIPPLTSQQAASCSINEDGIVDLDNCGAIIPEPLQIDCPGALLHGFIQTPFKSSLKSFTTQCDAISPEAKKDNRRGYIFLPGGAKVFSFSSRAVRELTPYLEKNLLDWAEYLDRLWQQEKAPPIIVTAVWATRSFACATYTANPLNTAAIAQVWSTSKGEKIFWAQNPQGFDTARAPLDDGYDENSKLKSRVEDQCFAIEGLVLKSRKAISRLHASQAT